MPVPKANASRPAGGGRHGARITSGASSACRGPLQRSVQEGVCSTSGRSASPGLLSDAQTSRNGFSVLTKKQRRATFLVRAVPASTLTTATPPGGRGKQTGDKVKSSYSAADSPNGDAVVGQGQLAGQALAEGESAIALADNSLQETLLLVSLLPPSVREILESHSDLHKVSIHDHSWRCVVPLRGVWLMNMGWN